MNGKKTYRVLITEILQKAVVIDAHSEGEARQRAEDAWKNGEYILDADSFQGVEYHVLDECSSEESEKRMERIDEKDI